MGTGVLSACVVQLKKFPSLPPVDAGLKKLLDYCDAHVVRLLVTKEGCVSVCSSLSPYGLTSGNLVYWAFRLQLTLPPLENLCESTCTQLLGIISS